MRLFPRLSTVVGVVLLSSAARAQRAPGPRDTLRLSLPDAVALAQRQGDEVQLSAAQVDLADAQVGAARSTGLPQLRINNSFTRTYESARGNAVGAVFNQPYSYAATASLSQALFQGGRIVSAARAASSVRAASRLDEQEVRATATMNVERAYLQALYSTRVAQLQDTNVSLATQRLAQVEQLLKAGRAAQYDVLRAQVERGNLEPVAIQAHSDADLALLDLKRLVNLPIAQPIVLTTRVDAEPGDAILSQVMAVADSLARLTPDRASVRSAEQLARARHLGIAVARADLLPQLSIQLNSGFGAFPLLGGGFPTRRGSFDLSNCPATPAPSKPCYNGGWFPDRNLLVTFSIPVFDGLRAKAGIDLAQAQERVAQIQLQQQREAVALEVARGRAEIDRVRSVFAARRQNTVAAQDAFRLASLRFERGLSTQLEVSDAQLALFTAQVGEARATYDMYLAAAEMARALGRPVPIVGSTPATSSFR